MSSKQFATMGSGKASGFGGWTGEYETLSRIPREWMAEYLVGRALKLNMETALNIDILMDL